MPFESKIQNLESAKTEEKKAEIKDVYLGINMAVFLIEPGQICCGTNVLCLWDLFVASEGCLHVASVFKLTFKKAPKTSQ